MEKTLDDMSLEELWQLFPIFLVRHKRSEERRVGKECRG